VVAGGLALSRSGAASDGAGFLYGSRGHHAGAPSFKCSTGKHRRNRFGTPAGSPTTMQGSDRSRDSLTAMCRSTSRRPRNRPICHCGGLRRGEILRHRRRSRHRAARPINRATSSREGTLSGAILPPVDTVTVEAVETGARIRVLGELHVFAESIDIIGPSLGAASVVPSAFGAAAGAASLPRASPLSHDFSCPGHQQADKAACLDRWTVHTCTKGAQPEQCIP
jgi:hypothetical protein